MWRTTLRPGGVGARIESEGLQGPFDELDVVGGLLVVLLPFLAKVVVGGAAERGLVDLDPA